MLSGSVTKLRSGVSEASKGPPRGDGRGRGVTVQIVVFKNYGRPNEERIAVTRRLGGVQEVLDIAEVNFP